MQNKTAVYFLAAILGVVLLAGAFSGGVFVGYMLPHDGSTLVSAPQVTAATPAAPGSTQPPSQPLTADQLQTLFKPFWESWSLVHKEYVDQPVDDLKLMRGAISGMLASLGDLHTSYMDPQVYQQASSQMQGAQYEGIGAFVDITGEFLRIISPMPDSPAMKAGLKPGDTIVAVDKVDMTGI